MLDYSTKREHCVLTGLQMLGLFSAAEANPEDRDKLVDDLLNTKGWYSDFRQWADFLELEPEAQTRNDRFESVQRRARAPTEVLEVEVASALLESGGQNR